MRWVRRVDRVGGAHTGWKWVELCQPQEIMSYYSSPTESNEYDRPFSPSSTSQLWPANGSSGSPQQSPWPDEYHQRPANSDLHSTQRDWPPASGPPTDHYWRPDSAPFPSNLACIPCPNHVMERPPFQQYSPAQLVRPSRIEDATVVPPVQHATPPAGHMFECDITFLIYCPDKNKQKKVVWTAVRNKEVDLSISFNCNTIDLEQFKQMVSDEFREPYPKMPKLLHHGTNALPPTMFWVGHLPRQSEWLKTGSQSVANPRVFSAWIEAIVKSKVKKGGLFIKMANPKNQKSLADSNDLMAATVSRHEAQQATARAVFERQSGASGSGPASQILPIQQLSMFDLVDSGEDSCDEGFDARKIIEEDIFRKYSGNIGVDPKHSVYPHPTDVNRYIILTSGNVASWARAIHAKEAGVSLTSPPSGLNYYNRKARKVSNPSASPDSLATLTPEMIATIIQACNEKSDRKRWHSRETSEFDRTRAVSPETSGSAVAVGVRGAQGDLLEYLHFAGVPKPEETMRLCEKHDMDSYEMFAEGFMRRDQLDAIGLTVGTLAKLCRNVGRYELSACYYGRDNLA
ncbi:hypothetical protein PGT21_025243 [Puccinia graminis f. sp. tritici]|uniref:Uncharacterized protein n=1 Tax=Puccinia graminis f. sp. tritici TaxID=56615 RepID=A0A5B0LWM4_PUCGR|nr:hypothetical protein PGTUg99_020980 [Puccinia graminis f. sp. tritici]KAA1104503.1 hypothetical protein PGT21_025243 [Puccinia graminis f. sp. tritici]